MPDRRPTRLTAAVLAAGAGVLLLAAPAVAAPCEGYSGVCAETPPDAPTTVIGGITDDRAGLAATGGEIAVLSLAGLGTVAGGAALVVAGRRKTARRVAV